jgi:hypothetical protein
MDRIVRDWHPLDRGTPPEYIPPQWDGPHVSKRMIEAVRTLQAMPHSNGPRGFATSWPAISHMFDGDVLAWLSEDPRTGLPPDRPRLQMMKTRPSSEAITRMEAAIAWPARYIGGTPQLVRTVQIVTLARLKGRDLGWAGHRLGVPLRVARRWNRDGLDAIAAGLRRDGVAVF